MLWTCIDYSFHVCGGVKGLSPSEFLFGKAYHLFNRRGTFKKINQGVPETGVVETGEVNFAEKGDTQCVLVGVGIQITTELKAGFHDFGHLLLKKPLQLGAEGEVVGEFQETVLPFYKKHPLKSA